MDFQLLYWHWVIFGIALMLFEIVIPSFTALWFGAAAIVVGLCLWLIPSLSVTAQLIAWAGFSVLLTWLWFKFLKPLAIDKTQAGLSLEAIVGEAGVVINVPIESRKGKLRFPAPILGSDEWLFIANETLQAGDRVRVIDISGNSLIVRKA